MSGNLQTHNTTITDLPADILGEIFQCSDVESGCVHSVCRLFYQWAYLGMNSLCWRAWRPKLADLKKVSHRITYVHIYSSDLMYLIDPKNAIIMPNVTRAVLGGQGVGMFLKSVPNVDTLFINDNDVTDSDLKQLTNLRVIFVNNNKTITTEGLSHMIKLEGVWGSFDTSQIDLGCLKKILPNLIQELS